jgi:heptosyltransferase-1
VSPALHAVERNRRLTAVALGYAVEGGCDYGLRPSEDSSFAARTPFALLLTMSSREDKLWPEDNWCALGATLAARGLHCVLPWGNEGERGRCARIATAIANAVVPPHLPLKELAALMARAKCVVGVDTGLTHVAAALGVPVLGLYCGSDPGLTGLYGSARARNLGTTGRPPSPAEALAALGSLA